jgi:hypothetical protein
MTLALPLAAPPRPTPPRFAVVSTEPEAADDGSDQEPHRPSLRSRARGPLTERGGRHLPVVPGSVRTGAREAAARRRAETVVRIVLEVFDGHRPLAHLAPYAGPGVLRYVAAGVPRRGDGPPHGVLRSLHCRPVERTGAEVTAVCRFGGGYRALAARLDLTPTGDWRCTALRVL